MPYALWELSGSVFQGNVREDNARAQTLLGAIHEHGLKVRPDPNGEFQVAADLDTLMGALSSGETEGNLRLLNNYLSCIRSAGTSIERALFRHNVLPYVQESNRSVDSALRNLNPGITNKLQFMISFVGKDIKHPLRFLEIAKVHSDYGMDPEITYSEAETGTYHTLQQLGSNEQWDTWSAYIEDSPVVRRYLRYIDSLASRYGMRLVYCPKEFTHIDEVITPARPTWNVQGGQARRVIRSDRYKLLYVSLAFDYSMFRDHTILETEAQPGQRARTASSMEYSPIFIDNLGGIAKVLTTLGSFAACKLYYKDFRNSTRSSQAAPSS